MAVMPDFVRQREFKFYNEVDYKSIFSPSIQPPGYQNESEPDKFSR